MGDEPQGVQPGDNEALGKYTIPLLSVLLHPLTTTEQSNAERKAELKAFKADIEAMRVGAITLAEQNAARMSFYLIDDLRGIVLIASR